MPTSNGCGRFFGIVSQGHGYAGAYCGVHGSLCEDCRGEEEETPVISKSEQLDEGKPLYSATVKASTADHDAQDFYHFRREGGEWVRNEPPELPADQKEIWVLTGGPPATIKRWIEGEPVNGPDLFKEFESYYLYWGGKPAQPKQEGLKSFSQAERLVHNLKKAIQFFEDDPFVSKAFIYNALEILEP